MLSLGVLGETALPRLRFLSYQCFNRRITDDAPYLGLAGWEAEEAEGVAADDFKNIGWGEAECLEEAAGVTRKIKGEVSWAWGVDAGEGEVLKEHAKFFSVGLCGGASSFVPQGRDFGGHVGGRPRSGRWRVGDSDGGFGPGGGSGGEAEGKFDVVAVGDHVGAGWASAEPSRAIGEETRADAPGHGVASGGEGSGGDEVLADGAEGAGERPGGGFGNFLKFSF